MAKAAEGKSAKKDRAAGGKQKEVSISATFPSLAAAHTQQRGTARGATPREAAHRAIDEIFDRRHVKGRHINSGQLIITIIPPLAGGEEE